MDLDARTLLAIFTLNGLTIALALPAIMGWNVSAAARCVMAAQALHGLAATFMFAATWTAPGSGQWMRLSVLSHAFGSAGLVMVWEAVGHWMQLPPRNRSMWLLTAVLVIGHPLSLSMLMLPRDIGVGALVIGIQALRVGVRVSQRNEFTSRRWRSLVGASMLALTGLMAWCWCVRVLAPGSHPGMLARHPLNIATGLVLNISLVLMAIGVLMAYREEAERQLQALAITDGLTGLLNRRAWTERTEALLADAQRYGHPLVVMMIDLDHFKNINDTRGHAVGDQALQLMARLLRDELRSGDLASRYGGEEFCVTLTHTREGSALSLDQRLRHCLRLQSGQDLGFTLEYSAGLAALGQTDGSLERLLRRADDALYEAKRAGRGQVILAPR